MDHEFRSAAFGGFQKQDVLDFLESNAQEHTKQLSAVSKQLEESEAQRARLDGECAGFRGCVERLNDEMEAVRKERDGLSVQLEELRTRCQEQEGELERLRAELDKQRAEAARLTPDAEAYAAVRDRTAGVELRALRRAQEMQEQAREQVRQMRQEAKVWLSRLQEEYAALRAQTKDAALHAAAELEQAKTAVEQMAWLIDERDEAMEQLTQAYEQTEGDKVPAPMPIPEE